MTKDSWTFITNHGAVLVLIGQQEKITAREIAATIGITERSVQRIIKDLETSGYIQIRKEGRVNVYQVNARLPLRHTTHRDVVVNDLLQALSTGA